MFDLRSLNDLAAEQGWKHQLFLEIFKKKKTKGGPVIGTTAIIHGIKGFPILLEAFNGLKQKHPDAILLVVGDFQYPEDKRLALYKIKQLGLKSQVIITGRVPHTQVLAWMREMDIFVLPSFHEATSNAVLEAMGIGLPIIATNVSGPRALIEDGKDGLLVPPRSVVILTQRLEVLIKNKELRVDLGQSAKEKVQRLFSPEVEKKLWLDVYNCAISQSRLHLPATVCPTEVHSSNRL